ncbi:uncharacterized protein LOC144643058 isoform X2 [Oculina patagonica]
MGTVEDSQNRTPFFQQISFGVGYVIFDVANLLLSSYRLFFLMRVVGLSASNAGWITLYSRSLGALIIRPMAGYLCDKVNIPVLSRKHGKKMTWHLIGSVLTAVSMPLFFSSCLVCSSEPSQWQLMVYHVVIGTCLPTSYVFIEIAHLSLVPFIAKNQSEAIKLNALRMACTFLTGIVTYLVAWAILGRDNQNQLTAESSMDFTVLTLIVVGIGLIFAAIFHIGTKEPIYDTSAKRRVSTITMVNFVGKRSLIPSSVLMQSMVCIGNENLVKDVQEKKRMCDQIIENLKSREERNEIQSTEEENSPVRKSSFPSRFICALFSDDKDDEIETNQASEEKSAGKATSNTNEASFSSTARTCDHEVLVKEVRALPQERKRSLLSTIIERLTGLDENDASNKMLANPSEETDSGLVAVVLNFTNEANKNVNNVTCKENGIGNRMHLSKAQKKTEKKNTVMNTPGDNKMLGELFEAGPSFGVDNKAFDLGERESRPRSTPDQITVANVDQDVSKSPEMDRDVASGTLMNNKPFVVSTDPEPALSPTPGVKTVRAWLKDPHFYKVAIIYASAKHLQELSNSYLPLFLTDTLKFEKESIAYLPLVMLVGATVSTGITKKVIGKIGSKRSFILAGLLVIGTCVWFYFITQSTRVLTYPAAALLGFGFSAMFVNALSFATELIGDKKSNSGFVFSFFGLLTSLTGGALVGVIQNFYPEESDASEDCEECGDYVRLVFSIVPGLLAVISLLIVLMFDTSHNTTKRNGLKSDVATQTDASEEVS